MAELKEREGWRARKPNTDSGAEQDARTWKSRGRQSGKICQKEKLRNGEQERQTEKNQIEMGTRNEKWRRTDERWRTEKSLEGTEHLRSERCN